MICPVCKAETDSPILAWRFRVNPTNAAGLGVSEDRLKKEPRNQILVCGWGCSHRVAQSWAKKWERGKKELFSY